MHGPSRRSSGISSAKEYTQFCRISRIFLVDGLEAWRAALISRGVSRVDVERKVAAAAEFVRRMGEAS